MEFVQPRFPVSSSANAGGKHFSKAAGKLRSHAEGASGHHLIVTFVTSAITITAGAVGINIFNKCAKFHGHDSKQKLHKEKVFLILFLTAGCLGVFYVLVILGMKYGKYFA